MGWSAGVVTRQGHSTRWYKLGCFKQALHTLVHLRKNETFSQLGAGFGIPQPTTWRYVDETWTCWPAGHPVSRKLSPGSVNRHP